ncbi:hypothetical protein FOZ61_004346 [Perkinsus olseni]|uniref:Uncharacterized protein n=1 Tax=Perkinsus olseni TaxID=32597 RepID=A0A7J6M0V3_PEROL|nr:hypothetical protein FOZ61_004346 [Perkinsus olseni]KAF4664711.1 hypothetical protein FOL46_004087 [Perkinsus olseni]
MAVVIPAYLPATGMRAFDCARSHLPYPTLPYRERSPLTRRDDPRPAEANTEHRATQKSTAEIDEKHGSHGRSEALELSAATEATRKGRGEMKFDGPLGSGADVAFEEAFPAYMDLLRGFERATGGDGEQLPQSAKANDDAWKQR